MRLDIVRSMLVVMFTAVAGGSSLSMVAADASTMIQIQGGGFIFNYRIGEAFYGVVVKPQRALPPGTVIEASFENPAGGEPFIVRETFTGSPKPVSLRTPPVRGVKADRDYLVTIRLRDASGSVIAETSKALRSDVDQSVLPDRPAVIGPGYHPNPETEEGRPRQ